MAVFFRKEAKLLINNDFESAIEYLKKESTQYPSLLTDKMDSVTFNQSFNNIESQLNQLYEKIRITEDLRQYCKNYVLEQINLKQQQFKEKLKIIEDLSDQYLEKEYIVYNVPISYNSDIIKDRDGNIISNMIITSNVLRQANTTIQTCKMASIDFSSNQECYTNNFNNLLKENNCYSYYAFDEPHNGIDETYTILFDKTYEANYIELSLANCSFRCFLIMADDNSEKEVNGSFFEETKIKGIKLIIHCDDYTYINAQELNSKNLQNYSLKKSDIENYNTVFLKDKIENAEQEYSTDIINNFRKDHINYLEELEKVNQKNILSGDKNN